MAVNCLTVSVHLDSSPYNLLSAVAQRLHNGQLTFRFLKEECPKDWDSFDGFWCASKADAVTKAIHEVVAMGPVSARADTRIFFPEEQLGEVPWTFGFSYGTTYHVMDEEGIFLPFAHYAQEAILSKLKSTCAPMAAAVADRVATYPAVPKKTLPPGWSYASLPDDEGPIPRNMSAAGVVEDDPSKYPRLEVPYYEGEEHAPMYRTLEARHDDDARAPMYRTLEARHDDDAHAPKYRSLAA